MFFLCPSRGIPCSLFFLPLFVFGCSLPQQAPGGHSHSHENHSIADEHGHDHAEERESASVWTEDLELFTEFPLLVAGTAQEFLLHLTYVQTGLPVQDVPVSFEATRKADGASVSGEAHPRRSGIYIIKPVFASGGEWALVLRVPMGDRVAAIALEDLDVHEADELHDHDHHEEETPSHAIGFTKEQQWVVPVVTTAADLGSVVERRSLSATVLATPAARSIASAPIAGVTTAIGDGAFPRMGDTAVKGELLALLTADAVSAESLARDANMQSMIALRTELKARAIEAAGNAARARALVAQHDTALKRAHSLLAAGAGTQREVDALRGTLEESRASLAAAEGVAAQAQRALEDTHAVSGPGGPGVIEITAPISGRIIGVYAGPGARVSGGDPLFEIVDTTQAVIEGRVPEMLANAITGTPTGMIELPGHPGALYEILRPADAPEPWVQPYVDEATRTAPVIFHTLNLDEKLRVGMTLTLWLDVRQVENAVRFPISAVVDENGIHTAYVMLAGETFQRRHVRLGVSDGMHVEVLEGVRAGERVASQGAYSVRLSGLADANLGSAHVH